MIRKSLLTLSFLVFAIPSLGCAHLSGKQVVDVRVIADHGGELRKYRTYPRVPQEGDYFYVEAAKGERYSVQVANRSDRRIGVVIAVDGRNIVNGNKSYLKSDEGMYIIDPLATHTFEGWRTGMDRTNRFYFTEQPDSYAEKVFSDGSAMGTIALAVYKEKVPEMSRQAQAPSQMKDSSVGAASPAQEEMRSIGKMEREKKAQAGTGFGETTYSPVRVVQFNPEDRVTEKVVLKYEWREELCNKGVIACGPRNRLWPDSRGFAPIPRDFKG
jgi:hypothetical protein